MNPLVLQSLTMSAPTSLLCHHLAVLCLVAQSCPTLRNPMNCSMPGCSIHGDSSGKNTGVSCHALLQGSSQPRDRTQVSCIVGGFFTIWAISEALHYLAATAKSLQSCPTLCDPIDGSPPGSPVSGILQARILEWVAISFSNA